MGFRTLAIEQRSSEVWRVLGAVKTEFGKFGDVLATTKERLDKASRTLDEAGVRTPRDRAPAAQTSRRCPSRRRASCSAPTAALRRRRRDAPDAK